MMVIPEELKEVFCCLKCKKVDAEYIICEGKTDYVDSRLSTRTVWRCKKCSSEVFSYGETEPKFVGMACFILAMVVCIIENTLGYFIAGTQFDVLLGHDVVIFLIFFGLYLVTVSEHKHVKKLLQNHIRHGGEVDLTVEYAPRSFPTFQNYFKQVKNLLQKDTGQEGKVEATKGRNQYFLHYMLVFIVIAFVFTLLLTLWVT